MSGNKKKTCQFKSKYGRDYKCPEPPLEDSEKRYCIFHEPTKDKDIQKFNEGIKRKLNEQDHNFMGYYFPMRFSFPKAVIFGARAESDARGVTERGASFSETTFEGNPLFLDCIFRGGVSFRQSTFRSCPTFTRCTFEEGLDSQKWWFFGVRLDLSGGACFTRSTFRAGIELNKCTFEGLADFSACVFDYVPFGRLDFERCTFKGPADFSKSTFRGGLELENTVYFRACVFQNGVDFEECTFQGRVNFLGSIFERAIYLGGARFTVPDTVDELFRRAKILWHNQGNYVEEGKAHYQEMDYIRKQKKWYIRYISANLFHRLLHGYGEKPHRVILWAIAIITTCALLFMNFGIGETRFFGENLPPYNIFKILPKLYTLSLTDLANIGRYFYFSVVTFTTLGYGDLRPVHPISHLISSIEAFTGMFMMALFVLTFGRKWRR